MESSKINSISPKKAVSRGFSLVLLPVLLILFGLPLSVYFGTNAGVTEKYSPVVIATIVSFITSWILWSFSITKWRIWAYTNVRNVHELLARAERVYIINPQGHSFEKTEIKSAKDRKELEILEKKFNTSDLLEEIDGDIIVLRNFKSLLISLFVFALYAFPYILGLTAIGTVPIDSIYLWAFILFIFFLTISFFKKLPILGLVPWKSHLKMIKDYFAKKPQLILNQQGIKVLQKNQGSFDWEQIQGFRIQRNGINEKETEIKLYLYAVDTSDQELKQVIVVDLRWTNIDLYYLTRILSRYTEEGEVFEYF